MTAPEFFHRDETKDAIREIASADDVTLIIGAGLSADQGLPAWNSLVRALVRDSSRLLNVSDEVRERFVRELMQGGDLLSAGSLAKAILGDSIVRRVHHHLYYDEERQDTRPPIGGLFAASVAEFILSRLAEGGSARVNIVTTNYDSLIEEAFTNPSTSDLGTLARTLGVTTEPIYDRRAVVDGVLPVYHIHGYVGRDGTSSKDVVLSERDFGLNMPEDWPAELMHRLAGSTWLFLGASIQDPNLNRYLRAASAGPLDGAATPRRFAAMALQGQSWAAAEPVLRAELRGAERRRLEDMKVEAVQADYFFQIPQLLHEITLARRQTAKYFAKGSRIRYGPRLLLWWDQITRTRLRNSPSHRYAATQRNLSGMMKQFRSDLEKAVGIRLRERDREHLKVELWIRNPHQRQLELWGSSENISTEPAHLPSRVLEVNTRFASVKAFCYGSIQRVDVPGSESRWQYFIGLPVVLYGDARWYQLPVACVSVASTYTESESALRHDNERLAKWREEVLATVRGYLTPTARQ